MHPWWDRHEATRPYATFGRRGPTGLMLSCSCYRAAASGLVTAFRRGVTGRWSLLPAEHLAGQARRAGAREGTRRRLIGRLVPAVLYLGSSPVTAGRAAREISCGRAFAKLTEKALLQAGNEFHD
jgi:hypothetical protein